MPPPSLLTRQSGRPLRIGVVLILLVLVPLGYSVAERSIVGTQPAAQPFLEPADAPEGRCVRDTTYMRYRHWELLQGVRSEVVRYGIRGDITIDKCRTCHKSRERFCNRCHDATSLTPDCFECHYYP